MMGVDDERALLADLPIPPRDRWLQLLYQCAFVACLGVRAISVLQRHPFWGVGRCRAMSTPHSCRGLPGRCSLSARRAAADAAGRKAWHTAGTRSCWPASTSWRRRTESTPRQRRQRPRIPLPARARRRPCRRVCTLSGGDYSLFVGAESGRWRGTGTPPRRRPGPAESPHIDTVINARISFHFTQNHRTMHPTVCTHDAQLPMYH